MSSDLLTNFLSKSEMINKKLIKLTTCKDLSVMNSSQNTSPKSLTTLLNLRPQLKEPSTPKVFSTMPRNNSVLLLPTLKSSLVFSFPVKKPEKLKLPLMRSPWPKLDKLWMLLMRLFLSSPLCNKVEASSRSSPEFKKLLLNCKKWNT